jgi:hypothetical protein
MRITRIVLALFFLLPISLFAQVPSITSLSPSAVVAGSPAFILTVTGTNYLSPGTNVGSVVQWNGSTLPTNYFGSTELRATVSSSNVASPGTAVVTVRNPGGQTSNQFQFVIAAPLSITTSDPLPTGVSGISYSFTLQATGGSGQYRWSLVKSQLPPGLALSSSGTISGTPTSSGSWTFFAQVDDSGTATFGQKSFTLSVIPSVSITGLSDILTPQGQPSFSVQLGAAYTTSISGKVTLSFAPDAVNPSDDPAKKFSNGQRELSFTINAGSTAANGVLGTGTVAGTVTLTVTSLSAGEVSILPSIAPTRTIRVSRSAPVITAMTVSQTGGGFNVLITGYSTSRDVTHAVFAFTPAPGRELGTSQVPVPVNSTFTTWYTGTQSTQFGSTFLYTQPFSVQGSVSDIGSVSVTLTNAAGTSAPASAPVSR